YSLRVLQEEDLIEPSSQGAITTDRTQEFVEELDEKLRDTVEKLENMQLGEEDPLENTPED
ncbi:MAG: hypothetical protein ABEI86_07265, partial [Halobacteriaceae archaeon]